ncbi:MAG: endonuclease MutS2 [Anaerolinea sp.]|nr:endonuclease MutS2 [Anaerolinea sp.]
MDEKTLITLEYPKILERLASYAAFSASAELARSLRPTNKLEEVQERLACTTEARKLLSVRSETTIGGATDIRPLLDRAGRGAVLLTTELLEIRNTLISARDLARTFERLGEAYPHLKAIAEPLSPPAGLIEAISQTISERGDILDTASPRLGSIRAELKTAHERLLSRLERMINDPKLSPILQEQLITQRNGRYVIPLRADFKGRIKSIVHDQSSSGATLFVEPLVVVELNNRWHELQLAERDEERRILAELSDRIGSHAAALKAMVNALAALDFTLMCAKYAEDLRAAEPIVIPFRNERKGEHPGSTIRLYRARHPLLDPQTVVPIDVDLDERTFALVITGPNTGGKTVTLKTVGLLALMAQSGLHIPAQSGSTLSLFNNIYADIGDEQSIEQSLSTFSGHITNIVRILQHAGRRTLIILDELGAGTDPQEGAALARAILAHLIEQRIPCLVATHYPELKAYAHSTPGVVNASLEFDLQTLRPTYHLTLGLPGRSNALAIAQRLGLPEDIIQAARTLINPTDLRAEDLLDEIHHQRNLARKARAAAEQAQKEAEKLQAQLTARLEKVEEERLALLETTRAAAEQQTEALQAELDEVRRALQRARQPLDAIKPLQAQLQNLQEQIEPPAPRQLTSEALTAPRPLRVGERVRLRSLNAEGTITALAQEDAEVQIGNLRVRARLNDIQRRKDSETEAPAEPQRSVRVSEGITLLHPSPGMELDLRGQRAEDAQDALETYLESAALAGLPFVRIIHGKGTGRLRVIVREVLRASPHVRRFETAQEKEGGDGVTIAHLED